MITKRIAICNTKTKQMKTFVLTISNQFPVSHNRCGDSTFFVRSILDGTKKHTIRSNYHLWLNRIEQIKRGNAILSIRYWTGKPYRSKQNEFLQLDKNSSIGIQRFQCLPTANLNDLFIDNEKCSVTIERLANNDGLSLEDFKEWFKNYDLNKPMAIIHFSSFRY